MTRSMYARILTVLVILCIALWRPSISSAEHSGDRLKIDAGLKMWVATWQAPLLFYPSDDLDHTKSSSLLLGPSLTAALKTSDSPWFNHVFVNFTYLTNGGKFDFDLNRTCQSGVVGGNCSTAVANPFSSIKADRSDLNLIVGTNVYRGLGAFVGYFKSDQTVTFRQLTSPATSLTTTTSSAERTINAFVFGVSASGDLSENLDFRGNLAGAVGGLDYRNLSPKTEPLIGWSSEVGLKWHGHLMPKIEPYLYFGFRVQAYEVKYDVSNTDRINNVTAVRTQRRSYEDITYGPVFQLGVQF